MELADPWSCFLKSLTQDEDCDHCDHYEFVLSRLPGCQLSRALREKFITENLLVVHHLPLIELPGSFLGICQDIYIYLPGIHYICQEVFDICQEE